MRTISVQIAIVALAALLAPATCSPQEVEARTFVGEINGTRAYIPSKYERSAFVNFEPAYVNYYSASDFRDGKIAAGQISDINLELRRSSFEPILNLADEMELRLHRLDSFDPTDLSRSWIGLKIVPTDGLRSEYEKLVARSKGPIQCDAKEVYGLRRCKIAAATDLFELSEYFYDARAMETIIWCRRVRDAYRLCTHLFATIASTVIVLTDYRSAAEVKRWRQVEMGAKPVASQFLAP
jgi:hypothetical protein